MYISSHVNDDIRCHCFFSVPFSRIVNCVQQTTVLSYCAVELFSTATRVGAGKLRIHDSISGRDKRVFSSPKCPDGAHSLSYLMATGDGFPGGKASTSECIYMYLHCVYRDNYFYFTM